MGRKWVLPTCKMSVKMYNYENRIPIKRNKLYACKLSTHLLNIEKNKALQHGNEWNKGTEESSKPEKGKGNITL